jgi:hypothetical protein
MMQPSQHYGRRPSWSIHHRAEVKDEPRDYAKKIRRFYREASDRLTELGLDKSEEAEVCWARMAFALDELREMGIYE